MAHSRLCVRAGAAVMMLAAGCARYVSAGPSEAPFGRDVRIELTPAGSARLGGTIGARAQYVEGRVHGNAPNGDLMLAASTLVRDNGNEETLNGTEITVPADAIARVQWRVFDPGRSALALVAAGGGAFLVGRAVSGGGIFGHGGSGGGKTGQ